MNTIKGFQIDLFESQKHHEHSNDVILTEIRKDAKKINSVNAYWDDKNLANDDFKDISSIAKYFL